MYKYAQIQLGNQAGLALTCPSVAVSCELSFQVFPDLVEFQTQDSFGMICMVTWTTWQSCGPLRSSAWNLCRSCWADRQFWQTLCTPPILLLLGSRPALSKVPQTRAAVEGPRWQSVLWTYDAMGGLALLGWGQQLMNKTLRSLEVSGINFNGTVKLPIQNSLLVWVMLILKHRFWRYAKASLANRVDNRLVDCEVVRETRHPEWWKGRLISLSH